MQQQQIREQSPEQREPRSYWQRYQRSKKIKILASIFAALLVLGSLLITIFYFQQSSRPQNLSSSTKTTFTAEQIINQVLNDENTNGWDVQNYGVYINWRRDDLSKINCAPEKCDVRGQATRHDGVNDLRDLENLYWYKARHPGDTSMDQYIARILPTVKAKWGEMTLSKGWFYFTLLRLATYSDEHAYWNNTLQHWLEAQYKATDPVTGLHHGPIDIVTTAPKVTIQDGYRVDLDLELGLALFDAGIRYQHPAWSAAGKHEVDTVVKQSFETKYHLFDRIYLIQDPVYGSHKVLDYQARMGENGQEIEALMRVGLYTKTDAYVQLAKGMLDSLETLPLHDHTNGGFYFKMYLGSYQGHDAGYVDSSMKETRQLHMLPGLHLANKAFNNRWGTLENELVQMATTAHRLYLPAPVPGFSYQVLPDGQLFPCRTCKPNPTENWVSAEAEGIALEGLQSILGDKTMPL